MSVPSAKLEDSLRRVVSEFGVAIQMPSLALDDDGRIDLMVGETPVTLCLVRKPEVALWTGCALGEIDSEDREGIEWLLREGFAFWAFQRATLGRDDESGMAQAFMLLAGAGLTAELLEEAVGWLVTIVQPLRARIAEKDFPHIDGDAIDPGLRAIPV